MNGRNVEVARAAEQTRGARIAFRGLDLPPWGQEAGNGGKAGSLAVHRDMMLTCPGPTWQLGARIRQVQRHRTRHDLPCRPRLLASMTPMAPPRPCPSCQSRDVYHVLIDCVGWVNETHSRVLRPREYEGQTGRQDRLAG